jgi:hypothetical protein
VTVSPTPEHPYYAKVLHDLRGQKTPMFFIICDEGWRTSIVCERLYEQTADWLVGQIQGKPYIAGE